MSTEDIGSEQAYVSALYGRLDGLRGRAADRLRGILRQSESLPRARFEREVASADCAATLARIRAAEHGLCFGRLDFDDGERRYIGRMGIFDEEADYEPLLIDWRTPAARPFYAATGAMRLGLRRRRHIVTRNRAVTGLEDDVFDVVGPARARAGREPADASPDQATPGGGPVELIGEPALFATLNAARTGRMSDIVATIQTEQDRIIRSGHRGILVVQGGPGTGKTAVALHRAAYLLYTHRDRLARSGVLVVGPHRAFLRYIENVLPSLGETSVVSATVDTLYPGVTARRAEEPAVAELKGRSAMAAVIAAAVRDRQRLPRGGTLEIHTEERLLLLEHGTCARARELARESGELHNDARAIFVRAVIDALARQIADGYAAETITAQVLEADPEALDLLAPAGSGGSSLLDDEDLAQLRRELRADPAVRAALDDLWPVLSPDQLVAELYADPGTLASAAPGLTAAERRLLLRPLAEDDPDPDDDLLRELRAITDAASGAHPAGGNELSGASGAAAAADPDADPAVGQGPDGAGAAPRPRPAGGWTAADIPLLDEAAELLGDDDQAARAAALRERIARVAYAQGVLDIISRDVEDDPEIMMATDLIDASRLADRHEDVDPRTIAQRALADRTWTFGHVVVDEAQELSEMAWRMVMRRCPTRSMTIVGDVAQTGDPAGTTSWDRILAPFPAAGAPARRETLTVNYRTPAEIMAVAADVLATLRPPQQPPRSVRTVGELPWRLRVPAPELGSRLARAVLAELARLAVTDPGDSDGAAGAGRLAVLVPVGRLAELTAAVRAAVPAAESGAAAGLTAPVVVLGVREAKGLEFDSVLIADPDAVLAESPRGAHDLYVALTRATRSLGVLHTGEVPPVLARLAPVGAQAAVPARAGPAPPAGRPRGL
ncbi:ATP-binding domain-containing protein [Frankia sp. AgB32]|uniref:HelD family protein n=1 Tax=Frankia sp. AgB32 TaxID=631119 RepID=UPI002010581F|nr:ATP-binding domain-containing protein [Frankia sp. AgB32]MCK9895408.1 ATP-binding domain-containing protein [Frankia sp. AgB32]